MRRRSLLAFATVAGLASAGLGWGLRWRAEQPAPTTSDPALPVDLWSHRFMQPGGSELALASFRGRPLVLNFWATWCAPCVEEMPMLDRFQRAQPAAGGWQVVGLAVDSEAPVREFLAKRPVSFPIGLAGLKGVELSRALGNVRGALPFSVIFDARGEVRERRLGTLQAEELAAWASRS